MAIDENTQYLRIQRHGDFAARLTVTLDGVPMDSSLYNYDCKLRDSLQTAYPVKATFLPGQWMQLSASVVAGEPSKIDIQLSAANSALLTATDGYREDQWPWLDVEMEVIANGNKFFVPSPSFVVEILETQAYD